jgi:UDP-4-amino-4,6-dideoxy-N-acetyl-beta-L-altrosamine transaminase
MIPYGRQEITQQDIDAVVDVLRSDFLTQGPKVPCFEEKLAAYCGSAHAVAVNSATSALHIACLALGLGKGDWLWTTPNTFVASANCALYCGAQVDFVDIDPHSWNMCPKALEKKLQLMEKEGRLPKVVVPVHLCGTSCDMQAIYRLGQRYGFKIIEDASHAVGGRYHNGKIGNCQYSDITVFSFHPVKIITTAEGGAAITNQYELAKKMTLLRSHGIDRSMQNMAPLSDGPWYYEQVDLGFNYRMTDLQAALGLSQLERLDDYVKRRNEISNSYRELLRGQPVRTQLLTTYSAMHLFVIRINQHELKKKHKEIFITLREKGIGVNLHYIPVYRHPYYKALGFNKSDYPETERYYEEAISLPIYPALTDENLRYVVSTLSECLK